MLRRENNRGSITVFLSLVLVVILSVLAAYLENARVRVASLNVERCLAGSLDATMTEYYAPLFEDYGLLFMDMGAGSDSLEYYKLQKKLQKYMNTSLSTQQQAEILGLDISTTGLDLYETEIESVQVDSAIRATEHQGDLVYNQVLQYMKYGALADGMEGILSYLDLIKDGEATSEVMEAQTKVDKAFEDSNELVLDLMETVEGISCSKGMKFNKDGTIKVKDEFAKKLCVEQVTRSNVGISNGKVWTALKGKYENPITTLKQIQKDLKELLKEQEKFEEEEERKRQEEERKRQEEEKKKQKQEAEDEADTSQKGNKKEAEEEKKKEEKQEEEKQEEEKETYDFKKKVDQVNQAQSDLKKTVKETRKKMDSALKIIGKLEKEQSDLKKEVTSYENTVKSKKDSISKEEYESLKKTVRQTKNDLQVVKNAIDMKDVLEKNKERLESLEEELGKKVKEDKESYQEKYGGISGQIAAMKTYSIKELTFSYGTISNETTKNPLDILKNVGSSVLELTVADSSKLSKKSIAQEDYYYSNYKGKKSKGNTSINTGNKVSSGDTSGLFGSFGDVFGSTKDFSKLTSNATNSLVYQLYIKDYFKSYVSKNDRFAKTPLEYEQEYILCGESSDKANLKQVINRILLLRTVTNFSYLLTDTKGVEKAHATAALLVGFTGLEPLVRIMQVSILATWAYEESLVDVAALLRGSKVPLVPTKNTFMLSYSDVFQFSKSLVQSKAKALGKKKIAVGVDYEGYLHLFLLLQNQEQKTYRTMDLIEANMKLRNSEYFSFEDCIYGVEVSCDYSVSAKFAALSVLSDWDYADAKWKFSASQAYSY